MQDLSSSQQKQRVAWLDVAKGLCILLVVAGHALDSLRNAAILTPGTPALDAYDAIYSFHMAAFFLLSGWASGLSAVKSGGRPWIKRLGRLAWPLFLWGGVQFVLTGLAGNYAQHAAALSWESFLNLSWVGTAQFWFLKALILIQILRYPLAAQPFLFLVLAAFMRGSVGFISYPESAIALPLFALFFALGACGAKTVLPAPLRRFLAPAWVAPLLFLLWLVFWRSSLSAPDPVFIAHAIAGTRLPAALAGTGFLIAFSNLPLLKSQSFLAWLGRATLPIYVLHVIFAAACRLVLMKIIHIQDASLLFTLMCVAGVAGPLFVRALAARAGVARRLALA